MGLWGLPFGNAYGVPGFPACAVACRELVAANEKENRTLAAARVGLLSKLLSGEVRVPEAINSLGRKPDGCSRSWKRHSAKPH